MLALSLATLLVACGGEQPTAPVVPVVPPPAVPEMPTTGTAIGGMASFDQAFIDLMRKHSIPGGAVAVMYEGRLVYARGFGYADVEKKALVQPDALFRIASVSKPITAAAVMALVEEGRLGLDDRVAPFIAHLAPAAGATVDPRWDQVTVRHLLTHSGGWDRLKPNGGFDPIDRPILAATAVGAPVPASSETLIRYMKGMPLDFTPGEKWAYSNFGYIILGRVIERVTGMAYADYVRTRVLQPVGATRTLQGRSRLIDAHPDEVKYYLPLEPGLGMTAPLVPSVFPGEGLVPWNYGGYHAEAGDASGAWISSTIDILRFVGGIDGRPTPPDILGAETVARMTGSGPTTCTDGSCYYSFGWWVRPVQGDANWWHGGTSPGSTAMLVRTHHNWAWMGLVNARSLTANLEAELDLALGKGFNGITSVPSHNLFSSFR